MSGLIARWRDRLPVTDLTPIVTLGEGGTPLVRADRVAKTAGLPPGSVGFVNDPDRKAVRELLQLDTLIDLVIPRGGEALLRIPRRDLQLAVAIAIRLLAVRRQEIAPARTHVAGHVLHHDRDRVRLRVERAEDIIAADLTEVAPQSFDLRRPAALQSPDRLTVQNAAQLVYNLIAWKTARDMI